MNQTKGGRSSRSARVLAAGVVLLLLALVGTALVQATPFLLWPGLVAGFQGDRKKVVEEEEEDTPAKPARKVRLVDKGEKEPVAQPQAAPIDLAQALREAKRPAVKALYSALLHPA